MKTHGKEMSMRRKIDVVTKVLNKSKGLTMLHGDKLIHHVANSITLYELPTKEQYFHFFSLFYFFDMNRIQFQKNRIIITDEDDNKQTWSPMREPSFEVGTQYIRYMGEIYFLR